MKSKKVEEKEKSTEKGMKETYDFVIIGAGVTGLAAAMYGARLGLKTLCLGATYSSEMAIGGVITTTNVVENYPGFIRLTGPELAEEIRKHAASYDLVTIRQENVSKVTKETNGFEVVSNKQSYAAKTVLFATGTKWKKLPADVKGGQAFENKGVNYCALCDAPLYRNKTVCVIGGSDTAAKDALVLAEHAKKVYIIYRKEKIRPEPINLQRVESNPKIEVINKSNIVEIKGDKLVKSVILDREYNGSNE